MMTASLRIAALGALAFVFTLACVRAEQTDNTANATLAALPADGPLVFVEPALPEGLQNDAALATARQMDRASRRADGALALMSPQEHMRRATVYHTNRAFAEAREHWETLIARFPSDTNVPAAMFGIGRSLFQERRYEEALPVFERLGAQHIETEAGRDGFYYVGATLLRLNRQAEAAARYQQYVERFPNGERIENAYLNIIDSLREAGQPAEALPWVARTRERFAGLPTATNALFARLRLEVATGDWAAAIRTSDELSRAGYGRGVMTSANEVAYLRAYSHERAGQTEQAIRIYQAIPDSLSSYYGWQATTRLRALGGAARQAGNARENRVRLEALRAARLYPAPHRETILQYTNGRAVDPRFVLAIMRQESAFNARAKSWAGARGLLQLTPDTAQRYAQRINLNLGLEDELYRPDLNIRLGVEYLADLARMFPGLLEAVAASYNGGEDNVERWVRRTIHNDPGLFAAEVGFSETKDYVAKVMANYRAYQALYTNDLRTRS